MPRHSAYALQSNHDICGYRVELTRKLIKNIYLRVDGENKRLRINAPASVTLAEIERLISEKTAWIDTKMQRERNRNPVECSFSSGENHYFKGQPLQLELVAETKKSRLITDSRGAVLQLPQTADRNTRERLLQGHYNDYLNEVVPPLLEAWQERIGVSINEWRLRTMKTRWGTCNIVKKRIWLNRELAKRSEAVIEYVIVHELIHLLERRHNKRFYAFMDRFLPDWRERRTLINSPLALDQT
jgi:predicted metal-dependent hydrolase